LFFLSLDLALGRAVGADQQVRSARLSGRYVEPFVDVRLAVGNIDQTRHGAKTLYFCCATIWGGGVETPAASSVSLSGIIWLIELSPAKPFLACR